LVVYSTITLLPIQHYSHNLALVIIWNYYIYFYSYYSFNNYLQKCHWYYY